MKIIRYKVNGYWREVNEIRLPQNTEMVELVEAPHEHGLFVNVDGDYECDHCTKLFGKAND